MPSCRVKALRPEEVKTLRQGSQTSTLGLPSSAEVVRTNSERGRLAPQLSPLMPHGGDSSLGPIAVLFDLGANDCLEPNSDRFYSFH